MTDSLLVYFLIMVTFGLVSAYVAYCWFGADRARREHEPWRASVQPGARRAERRERRLP